MCHIRSQDFPQAFPQLALRRGHPSHALVQPRVLSRQKPARIQSVRGEARHVPRGRECVPLQPLDRVGRGHVRIDAVLIELRASARSEDSSRQQEMGGSAHLFVGPEELGALALVEGVVAAEQPRHLLHVPRLLLRYASTRHVRL